MIVPFFPPAHAMRVILAAVGLVTLVGVALSVSNPLLALEMERAGISSTLSGLTATCAGLGTVLMVPFVPKLAARLGVRALLGASLALAAFLFIGFWLWKGAFAWAMLRFVLGAIIGLLFTLSEFWINAAAPPEKRGAVMGAYATALYLGFAAGPAILGLVGTSGFLPYLATALIMGLGLVPLMLAGNVTPKVEGTAEISVLAFVFSAPTATFAALVFGMVETGIIMQLPVHGLRLGLDERAATLLLTGFTLGNVVFQYPMGWISDRLERRLMLFAMAGASALIAAMMPLAGASFWLNWGLLFLLGGASGAIYTLGLAHLGARFSGIDLVSANAAFVMLYSVGLMAGPPLVGLGIDAFGSFGLPMISAIILALYAGLVLFRVMKTAKPYVGP